MRADKCFIWWLIFVEALLFSISVGQYRLQMVPRFHPRLGLIIVQFFVQMISVLSFVCEVSAKQEKLP